MPPFLSSWIRNTLVIYASGALLGYLSGGSEKMAYAMGAGLIVAPIIGLIWTSLGR